MCARGSLLSAGGDPLCRVALLVSVGILCAVF